METLLLVLDLVGTFVFALSGAMAGSRTGSICSGFWSCRTRRAMPGVWPATC
jgi:uncharacterized membrane protein YeiH